MKSHNFAIWRSLRRDPQRPGTGIRRGSPSICQVDPSTWVATTGGLRRWPSAVREIVSPAAADRRAKGPVYNEQIAIGRDEGLSFEKMADRDCTRGNEEASSAGRKAIASLTRWS